MISSTVTIIKNAWNISKLGITMFAIGIILCITGVILSFIVKLSLSSLSENISYVAVMIGTGIPFTLVGINLLLQPQKKGVYENYIEKNEILIIEWMVSIVLVILFFKSYPDGWNYPKLYVLFIPYTICIFLLVINILFNIDKKETEISCVRKEIERSENIIKEKEEMCKEHSAPDYATEFASSLKKNIDELKIIMDDLKVNIDVGIRGIAERTSSVAYKYKYDNERLHDDMIKFKQRTEKEKLDFKERTNERIIKNLMNMLYEIDELKQYRDNDSNYSVGDVDKIKENIYNILKNEGIDIINPSIGDDFDDKKYCAIQTMETDKFPEKKVVDIKKIGCMFKSGKVINYANVIVSKKINKEDDVKIVDNKIGVKTEVIPENVGFKDKIEDSKIVSKDGIEYVETKTEDDKVKVEDDISILEHIGRMLKRILEPMGSEVIIVNDTKRIKKEEKIDDTKQIKKEEKIDDTKQIKKEEKIDDTKQIKKEEKIGNIRSGEDMKAEYQK